MPRLEFFLAAESCSVDVRQNALSLFHVLGSLSAESFPFTIPKIAVAAALLFSAEELNPRRHWRMRIELTNTDGKTTSSMQESDAESRCQHLIVEILNTQVPRPGDIVIRLFVDDDPQSAAQHTIVVTARQLEST